MISGHYMANTLREHRVLFVFAFLLIGVFQVLILALVVGADLLGMVEVFYRQLSPAIRALLGDQFFAQFSVDGAVAFGYIHPLVLTMSILVAILLPARHIAGEVETGTLELVFALPLRRSTISLSLWLCSGMVLLGLVIGGNEPSSQTRGVGKSSVARARRSSGGSKARRSTGPRDRVGERRLGRRVGTKIASGRRRPVGGSGKRRACRFCPSPFRCNDRAEAGLAYGVLFQPPRLRPPCVI